MGRRGQGRGREKEVGWAGKRTALRAGSEAVLKEPEIARWHLLSEVSPLETANPGGAVVCVEVASLWIVPNCQTRPGSASYGHHPAASGHEPRRPRPPPILGDLVRVLGSPFGDFAEDRKAFWQQAKPPPGRGESFVFV